MARIYIKGNNMTLKTYEEVADHCELDSITKNRYVEYMKLRWLETEVEKCGDGYAEEWAMRFKNKIEYESSDEGGQFILDEIINKEIKA
jgi:hypothetical protein